MRRRNGGRRRGRGTALLGVSALVVACGGSGGDAGGVDGDGAEGHFPDATCDLLSELERVDPTRVDEPLRLDEDQLADRLVTRRAILRDLADRSTGELARLLEEQLLWQRAFDTSLLEDWEEERAVLAGEHEDRWVETAIDGELRREDGETIRLSDFVGIRDVAYERLVIGCRAPELAGGPRQEAGDGPPPGRLVYYRPDDVYGREDGGRLFVTDTAGEAERELRGPEAWEPRGSLDVVPDDPDGLLLGASQDDQHGIVIAASRDGRVLDVARRAPGRLGCPSWNARSDTVLAVDDVSDADERRLHRIDLTGRESSRPLDLPFAAVGCGDFVTDDRLVVGDTAPTPGAARGVWTVGVDGSDPREIHTGEECTTQVGSVNPAGTHVAVAQTCRDPLQDGIWVLDLRTGDADHLATGSAALPRWSPDGEWLTFGFTPLGERSVLGVWIVRADGQQLRRAVEGVAWYPVWLPPVEP